MSLPVALRPDYDAVRLRQLARRSKDAPQTRRLRALATIYEGGSRSQAAEIGGVGLQTVRDWVLRFNDCGPDGLLDGKAPGQPSILSEEHRQRLTMPILDHPLGLFAAVFVTLYALSAAAYLFVAEPARRVLTARLGDRYSPNLHSQRLRYTEASK